MQGPALGKTIDVLFPFLPHSNLHKIFWHMKPKQQEGFFHQVSDLFLYLLADKVYGIFINGVFPYTFDG